MHAWACKGKVPMNREYDLFEKLPDGYLVRRAVLAGRESGMKKLQELARLSENEFLLMDVSAHSVIASMNSRKAAAS